MSAQLKRVMCAWFGVVLTMLAWAGQPAHAARAQTAGAHADSGPFTTGWREVIVLRASGGDFAAMVYYPAAAPAGLNAPLHAGAAPYPAISFGHGYQQPVATYSSTLRHLATWGFIVIAPRSYENSVLPSHSQFADDLRDSLTYLATQNGISTSPFFRAVNVNRFGASGHSMGGGASLIAGDRDPRILAIANMAAAETIPSAVSAMSGITMPVRLIAGSSDGIVPPATNQEEQFNAGNAPKQAPLILGGSHCNFQDYSAFSFFCDTGLIPKDEQLAITRALLTAWFLLYLRDDPALWLDVWGPAPRAQDQPLFLGDDGITLAPAAASVSAQAGQVITLTFNMTNTQPVSNSYALAVAPLLAGQLSVTQTEAIGPNFSTTATLSLAGVFAGQAGVTLTVRSVFDGGTTDWANVTLMVTPAISTTQLVTVNVPLLKKNAP